MATHNMTVPLLVGNSVPASQVEGNVKGAVQRARVSIGPAYEFQREDGAVSWPVVRTFVTAEPSVTIQNLEDTDGNGNPVIWGMKVEFVDRSNNTAGEGKDLLFKFRSTAPSDAAYPDDIEPQDVVQPPEYGPTWAEQARQDRIATEALRDETAGYKDEAASTLQLVQAAVGSIGILGDTVIRRDPDGCLVIVTDVKPAPTPLTAPTFLSLVAGRSQATALWNPPTPLDPTAAITDYSIRYRIVGTGTWAYFSHAPSTALTQVITGLTNGATSNYEVQVAAVNDAGIGAYSTSLTVTPGAVNAVVFRDTFTRTAADLAGTIPNIGPQAWAGPSGGWSIDGAYAVSKSTAAIGLIDYADVEAYGVAKLTAVSNLDTAVGAALSIGARYYLRTIDAANYEYLSVGIGTNGAASFQYFCVANSTAISNTFGMPASAMPAGVAAGDYTIVVDQTGATTRQVTITQPNGTAVARTVTLASEPPASLLAATRFGITSNNNGGRLKHSSLELTVNGYYV